MGGSRMSTIIDKAEIIENLEHEAHEMFTNDGHSSEEAWILARDDAQYRYDNGLYYIGDYEGDDE